ncbi:MAG: hypothetical protein DCF16_16095 [Alphaproteobacteria bacterium]|nr:MAG: hypothetical protein DCF16_16095 [Alphaproteobacteria bacterium]
MRQRSYGSFSLPKFFFQVAGGAHVLDVEGRELADAAVARIQGIKFAGEILKDMPTVLYETASLKIDVTDEAGQVLFKVLVTTLGDSELQPGCDIQERARVA